MFDGYQLKDFPKWVRIKISYPAWMEKYLEPGEWYSDNGEQWVTFALLCEEARRSE